MTDPVFDKEGNLTNQDELTREEVAVAYQEKNRSVFGRLTEEETRRKQVEADKAKLEADLAEARRAQALAAANTPAQSSPGADPDELRLIARGLSDEEIAEAKDISKGKGISLNEALNTPIFKMFQENIREEKRKADAKLSASHGSAQHVPAEGVKSGQSREEHEAAWRKTQGMDTPA